MVHGIRRQTKMSDSTSSYIICAVCSEEILDFESFVTDISPSGNKSFIHNTPGCLSKWSIIKKVPDKCEICKKCTTGTVYFGGNVFKVCAGNCTSKLREKLMGNGDTAG